MGLALTPTLLARPEAVHAQRRGEGQAGRGRARALVPARAAPGRGLRLAVSAAAVGTREQRQIVHELAEAAECGRGRRGHLRSI